VLKGLNMSTKSLLVPSIINEPYEFCVVLRISIAPIHMGLPVEIAPWKKP